MSAHDPQHVAATLAAEDLALYAEKFFPHILPQHRSALIRELLTGDFERGSKSKIENRK